MIRLLVVLLLVATGTLNAAEAEIATAIKTIHGVGKEGAGNDAATAAWKSLTAEGLPALMPTLAGFQGANVYAANYLRSAVDAIVEAETKAGRRLPADTLKTFCLDTKQSPAARRIAFELFEKLQPDAAKDLIAGLIEDPSLDLRRDAIARRLELAGKDKPELIEPLFVAARDRDQIESIGKLLKKTPEDLVKHFNLVTRWHIIGPFDGPGASGFKTKYPPEDGVDLKAKYDGKGGSKIGWKAVTTKDSKDQYLKETQLVDFTKEIGVHKDAVAYAYAVIEVPADIEVDLRAGCQNGLKYFVNGKTVFQREAYHMGTSMDSHIGKAKLKAGKNELLIKVAQNDQKEPWAQVWALQLRICDSTGGAVPFTILSPEAQ